jgi:DNA-binding PadR family transcriptional regulator
MLTELEGAILAEIHNGGYETAFQVRRAFANSLSLEWKGSAGAVYPAVKRMRARGFIAASSAHDNRGARRLRLTASGKAVLKEWACDAKLATSVGLDPFRLRAGVWTSLDPAQRKQLFASLREEILGSLPLFQNTLASTNPLEKVRVLLAIQVQRARLRTLARWKNGEID